MKFGSEVQRYLDYEVQMQRDDLFKLLAATFTINSAMYPGSYIHISPSFYIPEVVYVDNYKTTPSFYSDSNVEKFVQVNKEYSEDTIIRFHHQDYRNHIAEPEGFFDLLISQYAGFISQHCKDYLKINGLLLVNNSHGDAGVAFADTDFNFIGVINKRSKKHTFSIKNLDKYFIPKNPTVDHSVDGLMKLKKGVGYTKAAAHYLFRKQN